MVPAYRHAYMYLPESWSIVAEQILVNRGLIMPEALRIFT
jgi:hypothetical protein